MQVKVIVIIFLSVSGLAQAQRTIKEYDFDHKVHYEQTKLSEYSYHIKVKAEHKKPFNRLATFLLRHSLKLCNGYDYKLTILGGIESVDDKIAFPNYIIPSLSANLTCPEK